MINKIFRTERWGRREIEQPKVGPKRSAKGVAQVNMP